MSIAARLAPRRLALSFTRPLLAAASSSSSPSPAAAAFRFHRSQSASRFSSTMSDQTIIYTKDAPARKLSLPPSSASLSMQTVANRPRHSCRPLRELLRAIEASSYATSTEQILSWPPATVPGHQDPLCHLLLWRHPPHCRRHLCWQQHHHPDHPVLREPQGRPRRGWLLHPQGRQDHDLHLRHGPLCRTYTPTPTTCTGIVPGCLLCRLLTCRRR